MRRESKQGLEDSKAKDDSPGSQYQRRVSSHGLREAKDCKFFTNFESHEQGPGQES